MDNELKYYEGKTFAEIDADYKVELNSLYYAVWKIYFGGLLYRFAPIALLDAILIDDGDDEFDTRKKDDLRASFTAFVSPKSLVAETVLKYAEVSHDA